MTFAFLVFLAAFGIEGIGTYVSVVGLSALFAANPTVIILAVALDYGKVIAVSFLYKYWSRINTLMKVYMTIATVVLVTITSTGAFGFLSGEFQKAISDTGTQTIRITTLEEEKGRLQKRKEEIDAQISKVNDNNVRGRTQLIKQFGPEVTRVNERLAAIDKELPELKIKNIDKELHVGPIIYIAKAFNTTPEEAVKWVILTIIFVFDPLAISLLIAGNFLLDLARKEKEDKAKEPTPTITNLAPPPEEAITKDQIDQIVLGDGDHVAPWTEEKIEEFGKALDLYEEEPTPVELELEPIEEPIPPFVPECVECGDDGFHVEGPGQYVDCEACTPQEVVELVPEEVAAIDETPTPPLQLKRHIKVEQINGRDVISLEVEVPKSSLESVSTKLADILPEDSANSTQTMKLRTHYTDETPQELVQVGGPK